MSSNDVRTSHFLSTVAHRDNLQNMSITLQHVHYTTLCSLHYSLVTTLQFGHYTTVWSLHYSLTTALQFDHNTTVWPLHYHHQLYQYRYGAQFAVSNEYRMSIGSVSNCINAVFAWFLCNLLYFFVYRTCILVFTCIVSIFNCIPYLHRFFLCIEHALLYFSMYLSS